MGLAATKEDLVFDQQLNLKRKRLGRSELMVPPLCFGSLRLTPENGIYKETLWKALCGGLHFIETSSVYGNGASEIIIGETLSEYFSLHPEKRDSLVLTSKLGMIQGPPLQGVGGPKPQSPLGNGVYRINERVGYCLNPEFIETQLTLSLRRLQTSKIQLVLIQNPEYLLKILGSKDRFFSSLKRAFEHLEVEVAKGRIGHYGISSNAFLKKEIAPDFLNLDQIMEVAQSISKKHHFSVIQVPFNLFESTPLLQKNQNRKTLFEKAQSHDMGVLIDRPLKSYHRDKTHYFITFPSKDHVTIKANLHKTLMEVIELEKELFLEFPQKEDLKWGHLLRSHLGKISDFWRWSLYLEKQVLPNLHKSIQHLPQDLDWNPWKVHYINSLHKLFALITDSLQEISNLRTNQISLYLKENHPPFKGETKLSNKVTMLYLSLPEIHSIVMGLSHPQHIQDLLHMGEPPSREITQEILKKIKMDF